MRVFKIIIESLFYGALGGILAAAIFSWLFPSPKLPLIGEGLKAQIQKLDEIQGSLTELQKFMSKQRDTLEKDKMALESLKKEKERLEPIVKVEKETIESILELQQEKFRKQVWKERCFGFLIGFLSSLAASSVFIFLNRKKVIDDGSFE